MQTSSLPSDCAPLRCWHRARAPYPGSRISDRGLSPDGSLLVDDGSPNYDIVAGGSPYELIPAQFERSASLQPASNAFLYGDQAAGGIADLNPFVSDSNWQVATAGSDTIVRAQVGSDAAGAVLGTFSNDTESRQRGDASATWSLGGDQSLSITGGSEQGRTFGTPLSNYAGSFSFVNATYGNPQLENLYASAVVDRGSYAFGSAAYSAAAIWSDSNFLIGAHTPGAVSAFADLGLRLSTGLYDQQTAWLQLPSIGATLSQSRLDAGVHATGADYDVKAGLGAFWIDYGGGSYGVSQPAKTALVAPSLQAQLFPNGRWSLNVQGSGSFTLPTFLEQYDYLDYAPTSVQLERNELVAGALTYTDLSRVRCFVRGGLATGYRRYFRHDYLCGTRRDLAGDARTRAACVDDARHRHGEPVRRRRLRRGHGADRQCDVVDVRSAQSAAVRRHLPPGSARRVTVLSRRRRRFGPDRRTAAVVRGRGGSHASHVPRCRTALRRSVTRYAILHASLTRRRDAPAFGGGAASAELRER